MGDWGAESAKETFVKTRIAAVAIAATATLALAACTPAESGPVDPVVTIPGVSSADAELLATFSWVDDGGFPGLEFSAPAGVTGTATDFRKDGTGDAISEGMILTVDYQAYQGSTGELMYSTYTMGQGETIIYGLSTMDTALYEALAGKHVGAELIYAFPDTQTGDSLFFALTVTSGVEVLERATGEAVEPVEGLPVVTLDADGAPSVSFEGATESTELVAQPLIQGDGPEVNVGANITVHYTGWLWDGEQFDSSWDGGAPVTFGLLNGQLIEGWVVGLAGHNVGSQVLLVIPSDLAYGDAGSGSIPGGATLVFVVDILAAS